MASNLQQLQKDYDALLASHQALVAHHKKEHHHPDNLRKEVVFIDVISERNRQDEKFGPDRNLKPLQWLSILMEEVGEFAQECNKQENMHESLEEAANAPNNPLPFSLEMRKEIIQITAVGFCILEWMERNSQ